MTKWQEIIIPNRKLGIKTPTYKHILLIKLLPHYINNVHNQCILNPNLNIGK